MEDRLRDSFSELIYETCRDQITEFKAYNPTDAGEKMRQCYSKFYRLILHQHNYYSKLPKEKLEQVMNG